MDWKLFFTTFATLFLAELGDKTQFAAMAVSSQTRSTGTVLAAVICALALAGTVGVLAGRLLGEYLNPDVIRYVSGSFFIAAGCWVIFSKQA